MNFSQEVGENELLFRMYVVGVINCELQRPRSKAFEENIRSVTLIITKYLSFKIIKKTLDFKSALVFTSHYFCERKNRIFFK